MKNTYLQKKLQITTMYNNIFTFKLHKIFKILQINKLYIISTEIAGTSIGHEASFVFFLNKITQ